MSPLRATTIAIKLVGRVITIEREMKKIKSNSYTMSNNTIAIFEFTNIIFTNC